VTVHLTLPPPTPVRQPAATDWPDRVWAVGWRPIADSWLPPAPATWAAAAAVLVYFPLSTEPAVRQPAAADWQDQPQVGGGRETLDFLPPPPPPAWLPA